MSGFRDLTIRRKLTVFVVLACTLALLLTITGFGAYEAWSFRRNSARQLNTLSAVIGSNSAASLTFNDPKTAEETLSALRHEVDIDAACLYDKEGRAFATYRRRGAPEFDPPAKKPPGLYFGAGYIDSFEEVLLAKETVGVVWVRANTRRLWSRLAQYAGIAAVIALVSSLATLLLTARFQRLISGPIVQLAEKARHVSEHQDYSVRAEKRSEDELGVLVDTFNQMLGQIELRNAELEEARNELEDRVESRTAELARAVANLERSNQELERFAYVASHDLQEPLRKVKTFGDRIRDKYGEGLGERGQDYLARMQDAATRMQHLINGLLDYSRVTTKAQPFGEVDLNETVRGVLSDLEVTVARERAWVDADTLPSIEADGLQMRQLFQNLLGNALKYRKPECAPVINISSELIEGAGGSNARFRITIADNGIGFEPEYAERIFGVFQRLHGRGEYSGAGIGLSVCRKIVERHGGSLTAEGLPGEGSRFHIELPVKQPGRSASSD